MGHHGRHEPSLFTTIIIILPQCSSTIMTCDRCKDKGIRNFTDQCAHIKEVGHINMRVEAMFRNNGVEAKLGIMRSVFCLLNPNPQSLS